MWATLHAFEHNNLDRMTLIPAPKYGQTLLRLWARKTSIREHLVEEWRPNTLGYTRLSERSLQEGSNLAKQIVSPELNRTTQRSSAENQRL
jgi:hypothetical protein